MHLSCRWCESHEPQDRCIYLTNDKKLTTNDKFKGRES